MTLKLFKASFPRNDVYLYSLIQTALSDSVFVNYCAASRRSVSRQATFER
jgi:hypothetical protein